MDAPANEAPVESIDDRIRLLEKRIGALEDEVAIRQLLATWGPAADSYSDDVADTYSSSVEAAASLWDKDAVYDAGPGVFNVHGADGVAELLNGERHAGVVQNGAGHLLGPPMIWVNGEHATAVCYHQLLVQEPSSPPDTLGRFEGEKHFRVQKLSATRWDFARGPGGWKITHRINRTLDGTPEQGRAVFAEALKQVRSPS
jgi:hypothetical protein